MKKIVIELPDDSPITPDEVIDGLRDRGWIDRSNADSITCYEEASP